MRIEFVALIDACTPVEHGVGVQRARVHLRVQHRQDCPDQVRNAIG